MQRQLRDVSRYRELHDLLSLRSPKVRIAWSYKTSYLDAICKRRAGSSGCGFP